MSPAVAALLTSAEALSTAERRELVDVLLLELEEVPAKPTLSAAWWEEIERRSADLDAGLEETVPAGDVIARLRARRASGG